ncbi:MAG TPA: chalcone isomerase family protein [Burkholderiales bacterium]
MTKTQRILLCVLTLGALQAFAAEVADVKVEERVKLGPKELLLNGAGLRTKAFFKVYVAGLYLADKKTSAAEVLALPGAKRVSMRMMRRLSAKQLTDALDEGIRDNTSPAEHGALKDRLVELSAIMNSIQWAKEGDVISLDWLPESGTRVVLNGEARGKTIAGEDFYHALLRIWLGDNPVSGSLKKALLGQGG